MRLFVTGAGGFLGAAVVKAALALGHEVVGAVRNPAPRLSVVERRVRVVRLDMADEKSFVPVLSQAAPDVVIHCAWGGLSAAQRSDLTQLDEVRSTYELVRAAAETGARKFVGIGSQAEYGPCDVPIDETMLPAPTSLYGAAKLAASVLAAQLAGQAGMEFAWLRLFATYGPGDNPNWLIPSLIRRLSDGEEPALTQGTQRWDYLYIDDAAAGVVAAATSPGATGVFNLSSGDAVAVRTIVEKIRDLVAPGKALTFGSVPFGPNQIMLLQGMNGRLKAATGWRPAISLDDGLSRTAGVTAIA